MEQKKSMTAVDWYFSVIKSHFEHNGELMEAAIWTYEQAKEKEKRQTMNAYNQGYRNGELDDGENKTDISEYNNALYYYKDTFEI